MAVSKSTALFGFLSLSFICIVSWKHSIIGLRGVFLLAGRGVLMLGLCTWIAAYLYPWLRSLISPAHRVQSESQICDHTFRLKPMVYKDPADDYGETKPKQELARKELQEKHSTKVSYYQDTVLRPRQETVLRQKEERFYRMTGETWKLTEGLPLVERDSSEEQFQEDLNETANQNAIRRRRLLENLTQTPVQNEAPQGKRVITLPEEPPEDAEGVVKVALRCPGGRTVYRKFLKSHSSSILLDWMAKTGYHPAIYTVCTSYPRRPLLTSEDRSLEDAGIVRDTVLNVEEKDASTT